MKRRSGIVVVASFALLWGCSQPTTAPDARTDAAASAPAGFVNRVWSVRTSTSVEPGTMYAFVSDGTLLITSINGTPALGQWTPAGEGFTMIEEGISYKVDILSLTPDELRIRIHNPGEPVEIVFAPAPTPPL